MATYKAKIITVTKVDYRLNINGTLYKNGEEFPMPTISVNAEGATEKQVEDLVKEEIRKFQATYEGEEVVKNLEGKEITL